MTDEQFWGLIEASRGSVGRAKVEDGSDFQQLQEISLKRLLISLPAEDILSFHEQFYVHHKEAYRYDIWGAAYWFCGGCGDDGFMDFRANLISLGRERFYAVMSNPDSLADLVGSADVPFMLGEGFQYIAKEAYKEKTGRDLHADLRSVQTAKPVAKSKTQFGPLDEDFDFDDEGEMARRYPRLVAKLPEMGDS